MQTQLTVLTDNTASYGLLAEWGLSVLVEVGGLRVLMDTGLSFTAAYNAQLLGVDLASVDSIVLSHGHADHTGGLRQVLGRSGEKPVIAHPAALGIKYHRRKDAPDRYNGIPFRREEMESLGARFSLSRAPVELAPWMATSGEVPMQTPYEKVDEDRYRVTERGPETDPLEDDLSLAVKTEEGLVVVLGCAHRGPVNILRHFQRTTGEERVHAVVGGMHLVQASEERTNETIRDLKAMGVKRLACGHCTGFKASARLAEAFGDAFTPFYAGARLVFPSE